MKFEIGGTRPYGYNGFAANFHWIVTMQADIEQLRQLPVAEKLRIVEALWDDIAASSERAPVTEATLAEVDRRWAELQNDPSHTLTREELWRRVDQPRAK